LWSRRFLIGLSVYLYLAAVLVALFVSHYAMKSSMVQYWFYTSWILLPLSFLVLAISFGQLLQGVSTKSWAILLFCSIVSCLASVVLKTGFRDSGGALLTFGVMGAVLSLGLLIPLPRGVRVLLVILVLSGSNMMAGSNFRMRFAYPLDKGPAVDRWQEFERSKPDAFSAIAQTALMARGLDPDANVWFWFDFDEPLGPVFNAAACTHWWGIRIVNNRLPSLDQAVDMAGNPIKIGSRIMVLSQNLADLQPMIFSRLHAVGITVRMLGQPAISAGDIRFGALLLEVVGVDRQGLPVP
jgi:uncharacterized membrane protein YhdT